MQIRLDRRVFQRIRFLLSALDVSDAQVKMADLIAASQQQKAAEKMQAMMSEMRCGMTCP